MIGSMKRKGAKLATAVSAILAGGVLATSAHAVNLTADGLGDAGTFQYYSGKVAEDGKWRTFMRIVNTSENTVAVKVRFREAANSREVLDFILVLSPYDMWNGWVDPDADADSSNGLQVGLKTNDTSCLIPVPTATANSGNAFVKNPEPNDPNMKYALFDDAAITDDYFDNTTVTSDDRLAEGYMNFIGLASWGPASVVSQWATHGGDGEPADCTIAANLMGNWSSSILAADDPVDFIEGILDPKDLAFGVGNVLAANAYLINVENGQGAGYDPQIYQNFRADFDVTTVAGKTQSILDGSYMLEEALTTDSRPNLDSATPFSAILESIAGQGATLLTDDWDADNDNEADHLGGVLARTVHLPGVTGSTSVTGGIDAVSAVLSRSNVINEWAARPTPGFHIEDNFTQKVMTFPTKHFYVDADTDDVVGDDIAPTLTPGSSPVAPFQFDYVSSIGADGDLSNAAGRSCEKFDLTMFDREEAMRDFASPAPFTESSLCWETNVINYHADYTSSGLNSSFNTVVEGDDFPIDAASGLFATRGWANYEFSGAAATGAGLVGSNNTYYGLPVTSFMMTVYGTGAGASANHTTIHDNKYMRDIETDAEPVRSAQDKLTDLIANVTDGEGI